jgi:hypothetical protein
MIARALGILVCVAGMQSSARADEATRGESTRGRLGVEATIGVYSGMGGGVRLGDERFGVNVTAAWMPLLVTTQTRTGFVGLPKSEFHLHSTLQANADVYLLVSQPTRRSSLGLTAGYKGSTHLGHGIGLGFYAEIDAKQSISYFLMGGVTYFPQGEARLSEKEMYPADTDFVFPGPALTTGVNLGMVVSP